MAEFNSKVEFVDDIAVIKVGGFIDAHTAPEFEKVFNDLIKNKNFKFVVNFSDLNYISSAGLGVLMGQIEYIRENGGDIKLTNLSKKVFKVFDLLGFTTLYEVFDDYNEGIARFKNPVVNPA